MKLRWPKLKLVIHEADIVPHGWGVAWWTPYDMTAVCFPIPFNLLFGAARCCYIWLREQHFDSAIEQAYQKGVREGTERELRHSHAMEESIRFEGYQQGYKAGQDEREQAWITWYDDVRKQAATIAAEVKELRHHVNTDQR